MLLLLVFFLAWNKWNAYKHKKELFFSVKVLDGFVSYASVYIKSEHKAFYLNQHLPQFGNGCWVWICLCLMYLDISLGICDNFMPLCPDPFYLYKFKSNTALSEPHIARFYGNFVCAYQTIARLYFAETWTHTHTHSQTASIQSVCPCPFISFASLA